MTDPRFSTSVQSGAQLAYDNGVRQERAGTIADLERMLGVCEYPEIAAFIPLLIDRLRKGLHRG